MAGKSEANLEGTLISFYKMTLAESPRSDSENTRLIQHTAAWFALAANLMLTEFSKLHS